jgi:lactoylglutathione lyase
VEYKLTVVRVFVTDWTRALRFYLDTLGMTAVHRSDEWGWAQMATGEGQLAIERVDAADDEGQALVGRFVGVSLQVPDVFATYDALVARGGRVSRPAGAAAVGRCACAPARSRRKRLDPHRQRLLMQVRADRIIA